MPKFLDLTDDVYGELTVIKRAPNENGRAKWHCDCSCGEKTTVYGYKLRAGRTKTCGKGIHLRAYKHGYSIKGKYSAEYAAWQAMKTRVNNPNYFSAHRYSKRGITYCERWKSFENFISDMGNKPSPELTLERRDNDGNYTPENCCWASQTEQNRNTCQTKLTIKLARSIRSKYVRGVVTQQQLAADYGVTQATVSRIILDECWKEQ